MIIDHVTFRYEDEVLIEKMIIKPPLRYEALFQDKGCFIYFKEKGPTLLASTQKTQVKGKEAVLLRCGNHFLDLLKEKEDEQVEVIVIHLDPILLKNLYIKELPKIIQRQNYAQKDIVVASSDVISRFIDSLEFYFQNPSLINNDLLELKIKELVLLLIQSENVGSIMELISGLYSARSTQLKEVIDLHTFSNLSTEELAKLCNLSLSSFKREFKKEFNDTPNNYITNKKLDKAKELLTISDLPINEIAFEIGFNDPLYFTRSFTRKVGESPTKYRKHNDARS